MSADWMMFVMAGGVTIGGAYVHEWTFEAPEFPEAHYSIGLTDRQMSFTLTGIASRQIAAMFGVPAWMIGIGKRPRQPKVAGQRGTGHHGPHRRRRLARRLR